MRLSFFLAILLSFSCVFAATWEQDLGIVTSANAPNTFSVELPEDFRSVEIANYQAEDPSTVAKYMGWDGYVKVNDQLVWDFKSVSPNGIFVFDRTIGKVVDGSSGVGFWLDTTRFFKAGKNTVEFYHRNQGSGIGVKLRITAISSEEAKEQASSRWGFGFNVKKSAGGRCSTASECQSSNCHRHICCEAGRECCFSDGECASGVCDDRFYYCLASEEKPVVKGVAAKVCDGCWLGDKCLPLRERLEIDGIANYCAVSGKFLPQKSMDNSCQNYYECLSGKCQGACISAVSVPANQEENLWSGFLNWLKSIFS